MSANGSMSSGGALDHLTHDDVPFLFDSVSQRPDGSIVHNARDALTFSFDYQGVTFTAHGRRIGERFVMTVVADLGPLPFSAESAAARSQIQDIVAASALSVSPILTIDDSQAIRVETSFDLVQPVSPVSMLTMVTELLLTLKPMLERLGALLAAASQRPQGTA